MESGHDLLPADSSAGNALPSEKEALRIQAAAVVAQQSSLTEEEIRLEQRRVALEQHEQQLASLLEEKRLRITALQDEAKQAHIALRDERAAFEKRVAEVLRALSRSRQEINEGLRHNDVERKRLLALRRRLKRRWHKHWAGEREVMRRREARLTNEQQQLQAARERLRQESAKLAQTKLRANAESELGRRHLRADRSQLFKRRQVLQDLARTLEQHESNLLEAEQNLTQDQAQWRAQLTDRREESKGLESRIENYRHKVQEQALEVSRLEGLTRDLKLRLANLDRQSGQDHSDAVQATSARAPMTEDLARREWQIRKDEQELQSRVADLERLSGELADQRHYLAEECERLGQARMRWGHEREQAAVELEALAVRLQQQEQELQTRAHALAKSEMDLRHGSEAIARQHRYLETWKARLAAGASAWQGERAQLLLKLRAQEGLVEEQPTFENQLNNLKQQVELAKRQRDLYEQQLQALREEIERLARLFMEEAAPPAKSQGQAA